MSTLETNLIQPSTGTSLTIGASGDTITIPSGATITNSGTASGFGGITMAQQWRLSSDLVGDANPITSNLEVVDTAEHRGWTKQSRKRLDGSRRSNLRNLCERDRLESRMVL